MSAESADIFCFIKVPVIKYEAPYHLLRQEQLP